MVILVLAACSNDNHETQHSNSDQAESMTDFEPSNQFIIDTDSVNKSWETIEESNTKERAVVLNPYFISVDTSAVGNDFNFNVYEEESLIGEVSRISTDLNGVKSISGLLHEDKGSFVFTVNEDRLLGQLRLTDRDKIIQIRFNEELNKYVLSETDRRDLDILPGSAPMRRGNN